MGATWNETPSANRLHIGVFGKQTAENLHLSMLLPGRRFPSLQMWRERQPIRYTRQWKFIRWDRARLWTRRDSMMKVRWENSAWNGRGLQPKKLIWQLLFFCMSGLRRIL